VENGSKRLRRIAAGVAIGSLFTGFLALPASAARDVTSACPANTPEDNFIDTGAQGSAIESAVDCLKAYGVTGGQPIAPGDTTHYQPSNFVTRDQMATFMINVLKKVNGFTFPAQPAAPGAFPDDNGNVHEANINTASQLNIVRGDQSGRYLPGQRVTRDQMATFIVATLKAAGATLPAAPAAPGPFADDNGNTHEGNIGILADPSVDIADGLANGGYGPADPVTRGQMAFFLTRALDLLVDQGKVTPIAGAIGPNQTFSAGAPELVQVTKTADPTVLQFTYDETITGQALAFIGPEGARRFTGFPIYAQNGTPSYPFQASISGANVLARYDTAAIVNSATRAGSRFGAVEDFTGIPSIEADFPFAPTATAVNTPPFSPQLLRVENYRTSPVLVDGENRVLIDFVFQEPAGATTLDQAIDFNDDEGVDFNAGEFYLVGSNSAIYQGDELFGGLQGTTNAAGTETTVTVALAFEPTEVPETELRRGFVVVGDTAANINPAGVDNIGDADADALYTGSPILSEEYGTTNGLTVDPDLATVTRGAGTSTTFSFQFDEAVSDTALDQTNFGVFDAAGNVHIADNVVRSAQAGDEARVVLATIDDTPGAGGAGLPATGAGTPVSAFVIDDAVRATDSTAQANGGFNRPHEVDLTLPAPSAQQIPPGVTALPDLTTITRSRNSVTGNMSVTFTTDSAIPAGNVDEVDFDLYDNNGTRFNVHGVTCATSGVSCSGNNVTFSIDGGFTILDNEQIIAAVTGGIQTFDIVNENATATVDDDVLTPVVVTEGQVGLTG